MESREVTIRVGLVRQDGHCCKCDNQFTTYRIPDYVYGSRLLRTLDGKRVVYACFLDDQVCDEVEQMLIDEKSSLAANEPERIKLFDEIIGETFDPIDGHNISAVVKQRCPQCGYDKIELSDVTPPVIEQVTLPEATHRIWDAMSLADRQSYVANFVSIYMRKKHDRHGS